MKVHVNFTVDVDADSWAADYNIDRSDVPDDVKRHLRNIAVQHMAALGHLLR